MLMGKRLFRITSRIPFNPVTIGMICLGGLFIAAAQTLPAARFDPLGAAPFPSALGWLIVVLGSLELAQSFVRRNERSDATSRPAIGVRAVAVFVFTMLYALSMAIFDLRFEVATIAYLVLASLAFGRPRGSQALVLLVLFPAAAVLLSYLLKEVVYIALP